MIQNCAVIKLITLFGNSFNSFKRATKIKQRHLDAV